ncbi:hypothetical protein WA026_019497 [Henosepilachna vigintioctopunctata]|uniref:Uncharacterized protein n=1 Tax=Henosepilachna vigintioctopunctata TaxID=420089 RepID=A0AAW1TYB7_9CUCU
MDKKSGIMIIFMILHIQTNSVARGESDEAVHVLQIKHIKIENYSGPINADVMRLFENVEIMESINSNYSPSRNNFFFALPNLKKIHLYESTVEIKINDDISQCCKNLNEMIFVRNGADRKTWQAIGREWPLKTLCLIEESVPSFETDLINNIHLENLTIYHSGIQMIDNTAFEKIFQLKYLYLQKNEIKSITKEILAPLEYLKVLDLEGNQLEKLTTDQFPFLPNLEKLNVANNPIKEINLEGIKEKAPMLSEVDISGIEGIDVPEISGIKFIT